MEPTCWLDEDGKHVWFKHDCLPHLDKWRLENGFTIEHILPMTAEKGWTVTQKEPLTLTPSIQCLAGCNTHGFFTNGKWVSA